MALTQLGTDGIKDDAVTLAKRAGLTRGSVVIGDASGNPSNLTKGAAGKVLTSDGTDLSWGAVPAGGIGADAITGAKIADDALASEHYTDGSIDHAHLAADCVDGDNIADDSIGSEHIADNAVGLAAMASGTDGQVLTYDASGNPVAVGPGTDGQVLTSTGAGSPPAFEDVPAGGATINNATANELVTVASTTTQLDAESNLTFDGNNLTLGDGNIIFADGHGIDFSSHGTDASGRDNELLSHTEYGTWDPVDQSDSDISTGTGHYAVVGRFCYIVATFNSDNPSSSVTHIKGQPFAPQRLGYNQHTYALLYKNPGGGGDESGLSLWVSAQNTHSTGAWHIVTDHSGFGNTDYSGFNASYVIN